MLPPFRVADRTYIVPLALPVPARGVLPMNPLIIAGEEPVIVDTGPGVMREQFLNAAFSLVNPGAVKWIFISHDDRDHVGSLMLLLELCQSARLITSFQGLARITKEYELPLDRLVLLNHGERLRAGDRDLISLRPPLFDSPATRGLFDTRTGLYYGVDSFAALLPEYYPNVADVPHELYVEGFNWLNRANAPWYTLTDPVQMQRQIDHVRRLQPEVIVSYHGPVAFGISEQLCRLLADMPRDDDIVFPDLDDVIAAAASAIE